MLKNTYSPLLTIFNSSAASIISRIVLGLAHIMTTEKNEKKNLSYVKITLKKRCVHLNAINRHESNSLRAFVLIFSKIAIKSDRVVFSSSNCS